MNAKIKMKNLRMGESCRRIFRETSPEQRRDFQEVHLDTASLFLPAHKPRSSGRQSAPSYPKRY
jgi:hypothetical protein